MKVIVIVALCWVFEIAVGLAWSAAAVAHQPERYYQEKWCAEHKGSTEVVLSDRTRVDCLTEAHAIEFDFGHKWAEAIGQALGYAIETNRRPGIVLIVESHREYKHWIKLNSVIDHFKLPIDTWIMQPE